MAEKSDVKPEVGAVDVKLMTLEICGICAEEEGQKRLGVKYCVNCSQWLCVGCVSSHRKFPSLKTHVLEDEARKLPVSESPCVSHPSSMLLFFCTICNEPACYECRVDDGKHRSHKCVRIDDQKAILKENLTAKLYRLNVHRGKVEEKLRILDIEFEAAHKQLTHIEKGIANLHGKLLKKKNDVGRLLENELKRIAESVERTQHYMNDFDDAITTADLSKLSAANTRLPEIPNFKEGLTEMSVKLMLGKELSHELVLEAMKLVDIKFAVTNGTALLNLNQDQIPKLTKFMKSATSILVELGHHDIIKLIQALRIHPQSMLTEEQVAGLLKPGVRVKQAHEWGSRHMRGWRGTVLKERDSDQRVEVRWNDGREGSYSMGREGHYYLTLLLD